ncbi:unnamed protein product [Brugia timori]|uniref:Uncharacterized protein n=1 Tax=Brugia timori TaxID=42155 RepID=A0A0R3R8R3_9BILA|nr:unnamed protein product [Brugia timori]
MNDHFDLIFFCNYYLINKAFFILFILFHLSLLSKIFHFGKINK